MSRVLVTGATGFIGTHLLDALRTKNYSVIATTRGHISEIGESEVEWIPSNYAENVIEAVKPIAVIHLATDYGFEGKLNDVILSNEEWPLRLLQAAIRVGTPVFLNTDSFFGKRVFNYPHMRSYTLSKSNFTAWARLATESSKTRFITMRLEHVFGEGDNLNKFVPSMLNKLIRNSPFHATMGTQCRDFVYVGDVVNAYMTVLNNVQMLAFGASEIEVGTGKSIPVRSFVETARKLIGSSSQLHFGSIPMRQNEIMNSYADVSVIERLGWKCQISLVNGLERCISQMKEKDAS